MTVKMFVLSAPKRKPNFKKMASRTQLLESLRLWYQAWNAHDLDGVLKLIHEDILFVNWDGTKIIRREREMKI